MGLAPPVETRHRPPYGERAGQRPAGILDKVSAMDARRSLMVLALAWVAWAAPAAGAEKTPPQEAAKFMEPRDRYAEPETLLGSPHSLVPAADARLGR